MAIAQRPMTEAALSEVVKVAAWKGVSPSFVYADKDIPPTVIAFIAERVKSKQAVV